jgi:hypothetical protein
MLNYNFACIIREDSAASVQFTVERRNSSLKPSQFGKILLQIPYLDVEFNPNPPSSNKQQDSSSSESSDDDYKAPRISPEYQCAIPERIAAVTVKESRESDKWMGKLRWAPHEDMKVVEKFLNSTKVDAKYDYGSEEKDDDGQRDAIRENLLTLEETLQLLCAKKFNFNEILEELMSKNQYWSYKKRRIGAIWSADEIDIFEAAYQRYGDKDFLWTVKEKLGNSKTIAQVVQYYYITKKAPRLQMLSAQERKSKSKTRKNDAHFMLPTHHRHHGEPMSRINGRLRNKSKKDYHTWLGTSEASRRGSLDVNNNNSNNRNQKNQRGGKTGKPDNEGGPVETMKSKFESATDFPNIHENEDEPIVTQEMYARLYDEAIREDNLISALVQIFAQSKYHACIISEVLHEWRALFSISLDELLEMKVGDVKEEMLTSLVELANGYLSKLSTVYRAYLLVVKKTEDPEWKYPLTFAEQQIFNAENGISEEKTEGEIGTTRFRKQGAPRSTNNSNRKLVDEKNQLRSRKTRSKPKETAAPTTTSTTIETVEEKEPEKEEKEPEKEEKEAEKIIIEEVEGEKDGEGEGNEEKEVKEEEEEEEVAESKPKRKYVAKKRKKAKAKKKGPVNKKQKVNEEEGEGINEENKEENEEGEGNKEEEKVDESNEINHNYENIEEENENNVTEDKIDESNEINNNNNNEIIMEETDNNTDASLITMNENEDTQSTTNIDEEKPQTEVPIIVKKTDPTTAQMNVMKVKEIEQFISEKEIFDVFCLKGSAYLVEKLEGDQIAVLFFKLIPKLDVKSIHFFNKLSFRLENACDLYSFPEWFQHYLRNRKNYEYLIEEESPEIDIDDFIDSTGESEESASEVDVLEEKATLKPIDRSIWLFFSTVDMMNISFAESQRLKTILNDSELGSNEGNDINNDDIDNVSGAGYQDNIADGVAEQQSNEIKMDDMCEESGEGMNVEK